MSSLAAICVRSTSEATTLELAEALAEFLKPGSVVAIEGELGAGKTCFVRGLVKGLAGSDVVVSPTFTYENRYALGRIGQEFLHMDLYRIEERIDTELLSSLREAREAGAVIAVEWARAWLEFLQPCLHLAIAMDGSGRTLRLAPLPGGWRHLESLAARWAAIAGACQ